MRKYNVGDEVLVKGTVIEGLDEDGDYCVNIKDGTGTSENVYVDHHYVLGKLSDYNRVNKYEPGDVLKRGHQCCVISKLMDDGCILTFPDGSGSFYSFDCLDKHFTHHGVTLEYELEEILSRLRDDAE